MKQKSFYLIIVVTLLSISNLFGEFDTQYANIDSLSYEWQVSRYSGGTDAIPDLEEDIDIEGYINLML